MFTAGSGTKPNGAYVRFAVRQMTSVNKAALQELIGDYACSDGSNRSQYFVLLGAFEEVAACSRTHGGEDGIVVLEHRQHEDPGLRMFGDDLSGRVDPVQLRHADVHQDDVRVGFQRYAHDFGAVGDGVDHLDVGCRLEEGA